MKQAKFTAASGVTGDGPAKKKVETGVVIQSNATALQQARMQRHLVMLEILRTSREAQAVREVSETLQTAREGVLTDMSAAGLGQRDATRRIGGRMSDEKTAERSEGNDGFKDPLGGRRNQHPRSTVVGPGSLPRQSSLTRQDGNDADTQQRYQNGSDEGRRGTVWQERRTERSTADGRLTVGSALYRDTGGSHWRVDYRDERQADGSLTSTETVYDGHGEAIKTTVREGNPDGTATETTTYHETGKVETRTGTFPEIFPEGSQTGEEGRGDRVAPRGWHNPITGQTQNAGVATSGNQINPGRESHAPAAAAAPLIFDPNDLAVNPPLDAVQHRGQPRDIRTNNPTIIDPPRPPAGS